MISISELKKIVGQAIEEDGNSSQENWDSICHINILVELDKKLDGKVANISGIQNKNSIASILECLKAHNLIEIC